jgi:putative transposase
MPQLTAMPIMLSESEKAELEKLLRRSRTSRQISMRAKIILRASAGEGHGEISRALGITLIWAIQVHCMATFAVFFWQL